jgi:hypothetical protein
MVELLATNNRTQETSLTYVANDNCTIARSSAQNHTPGGAYSVAMTVTVGATEANMYDSGVWPARYQAVPGQLIAISFWAYSSADCNVRSALDFYLGDNTKVSTERGAVVYVNADTWTYITHTFTAPAGVDRFMPLPMTGTIIGAGQVVYFDDFSAATVPHPAVPFAAVETGGGWTVTGPSAQEALADSDMATLITSPNDPTAATRNMTLPPITPPDGDLKVIVEADRVGATSASVSATLLDGATVVATAPAANIPVIAGDVTLTFPAASLTGVTEAKWWAGTLVVRYSFTAA